MHFNLSDCLQELRGLNNGIRKTIFNLLLKCFIFKKNLTEKLSISLVKRVKMWCILVQKCFRYGKIKFLQHIALVCVCVRNGSNLSANNMIKRKQLKITKTAITTQIAEKWGKALTEITSRSNWSFKGCKNNLV